MKAQFEANLVLQHSTAQHSTAQHSTAQHIEKLKRKGKLFTPFSSIPCYVFILMLMMLITQKAQSQTCPDAILNLEVDDENIGLRIRNEYLNTQENTTPRCFDNLGRQINCPDKWDAKVIKRKTKSGDFIIVK